LLGRLQAAAEKALGMTLHDVKHHHADKNGDYNQYRPYNQNNPLLTKILLFHILI